MRVSLFVLRIFDFFLFEHQQHAVGNGKTVVINGVTVIGNSNLAASLPASASPLYAKNILNFLDTMYNKEEKSLNYNFEDELIKGTCLCYNGKMIHPSFTGA